MLLWKEANLFHAICTVLVCAKLLNGNIYIQPVSYKDKVADIAIYI
jgi:hypothetical protein